MSALPDLSRAPSLTSSVIKGSDLANSIVKAPTQSLLSDVFRSKERWSAMTPSPFSATSTWKGMLDHTEWQSLYIPKSATSGFGLINTIAGLNAAWPLKDPLIVDVMRQMDVIGRGLDGFMSRMMPTMDVIGCHLSGIAEFIERIDWETIVESWRVQEARRPRTKIGFAALDAYDALYMGHPWVADRFLIEYLGIKPSDETREALWIVLREAFERTNPKPATWILLDNEQATRYLRRAVWNEVGRIKRDREMADRIWWPEGEEEEDEEGVKFSKPALSENNTLDFIVRKSPSPERLLIPPPDPRGQVLQLLYFEGTEQDKKIVEMLIAGFDLPGVAEVFGWSKVLAFMRKAQRWRRIKLDPPANG